MINLDWQQERALKFLRLKTDSALAENGSTFFFDGSEAVILSAVQVGQMMKGGLVKFCADAENAIEITDAGRVYETEA